MSDRFGYSSGFEFDVTERERDARRTNLESVFTGSFKPVPLGEALERGRIEDGAEIAELCEEQSLDLFPKDTAKKEKMAFILCYTFDNGKKTEEGKSKNPFRVTNKVLDDGETIPVKRLSFFLWGLLSALRSLPYMQYDELYRGLNNKMTWEKGDIKVWCGFTSMSRIESVGHRFVSRNETGDEFGTLIIGHNFYGYDISKFSSHEDEHEVILEPYQSVTVLSVSDGDLMTVDVSDSGNTKPVLDKKIGSGVKISLPVSKHLVEGLDHHKNGRHIDAFKSFLKAAQGGSAIAKLNLLTISMRSKNAGEKEKCPFDESLDFDLFEKQKESVLVEEFGKDWRDDFWKLAFSAGEIQESEIESMKELSNAVFSHPGCLKYESLYKKFILHYLHFFASKGNLMKKKLGPYPVC